MATNPMQGDVTKLPKWAQRRIEILEMRVREGEEKYERAMALSDLQPDDRDFSIIAPSKKYVYFDADTDGISVKHDKGVLEVRAAWGGTLSIRPVVSNGIEIVTEMR